MALPPKGPPQHAQQHLEQQQQRGLLVPKARGVSQHDRRFAPAWATSRSRSRSRSPPQAQASYAIEGPCILGKGSFGVVFKATVVGSGRPVAIKAVRFREGEREAQALRRLRGSPNIVTLHGTFPGNEAAEQDRTLNLVMEFISDTLMRIIKHYRASAVWMDIQYVRLFIYQLLRGLASLERAGVVHRDIKPANLLVHPDTLTLKICDFGTARLAGTNEVSTPYLCSRYYRAPELILSSMEYAGAVDLWSAGCVLAEMLLGQPLFAGRDGVDQLHKIMEVLGSPTPQELYAMNPQYDAAVDFGSTHIEALPWEKVLGRPVDAEAIALLGQLLKYDPSARVLPLHAMASSLFDELRRAHMWQRNSGLLSLTEEELAVCPPGVRERLLSRSGIGGL